MPVVPIDQQFDGGEKPVHVDCDVDLLPPRARRDLDFTRVGGAGRRVGPVWATRRGRRSGLFGVERDRLVHDRPAVPPDRRHARRP